MARKDKKNRNLKVGESQRSDGRYMYRYTDSITGKRRTIYDWDLASLREKEKKIARDMDDRLITDPAAKKMTLNTLFERYMSTKEIKESTRRNYESMWNNRVRDTIGKLKVVEIKPSQILLFYSGLSKEGIAHNTIKYLHTMISPALELAVDDDIIRKNPAKGALGNYGKSAKEKEALTIEQEKKLLAFVANSNVYQVHLPMIKIMLGTCMRVGEVIGLTWSDVDLKKKEVYVTKQLIYKNLGDGYRFHISTPKTDAGVRKIPMTQIVYKAFVRQKELNLMLGMHSEVEISGCKNFIFVTKNNDPIMPAGVNSFLKNIVNAYNEEETKLAEKEKREPELMPHISAHTLRHTGCTRLGEHGVDPKVMQYIMGHTDASITMNVYNHMNDMDRVRKELGKIERAVV